MKTAFRKVRAAWRLWMERCPRCGELFSHWYRWQGLRYCFPCWSGSGHTLIINENGEGYDANPE